MVTCWRKDGVRELFVQFRELRHSLHPGAHPVQAAVSGNPDLSEEHGIMSDDMMKHGELVSNGLIKTKTFVIKGLKRCKFLIKKNDYNLDWHVSIPCLRLYRKVYATDQINV